jgi:hypothetical protein
MILFVRLQSVSDHGNEFIGLKRNIAEETMKELDDAKDDLTVKIVKECPVSYQANRHGLLVPSTTTDQELAATSEFPTSTPWLLRGGERLSAHGNVVACNVNRDFHRAGPGVETNVTRDNLNMLKEFAEIFKLRIFRRREQGSVITLGKLGYTEDRLCTPFKFILSSFFPLFFPLLSSSSFSFFYRAFFWRYFAAVQLLSSSSPWAGLLSVDQPRPCLCVSRQAAASGFA